MYRYACFLLLTALVMLVSGQDTAPAAALSLDSAIGLGLKSNPELKASWQKVKASKGRFWSAISPPATEMTISRSGIPKGKALNDYGEKTLEFSQAIEFPTNYVLRGSRQSIEQDIAETEYAMTKTAVIARVKAAYYKAFAVQEQIKVDQDNLAIAKDFVTKAEIRHKVGEGTGLEKMTAKVQYSEAVNNLEIQKNERTQAFTELNFSMGFGKTEVKEYRLTDTLCAAALSMTLEQLLDMAAKSNPRFKISELQVKGASVDRALAWSSILPNFGLGYCKQTIVGDNSYYGVSLGVSLPIWFLLEQKGKVQEASGNLSAARADLQAADNSLSAAIRNAYAEFRKAERQVQFYKDDILPQAEEIYRAASKSYEAGEITYVEFLQARQTLISAKCSYVDALLAYHLSIVAIEETVGTRLN